MAIADRNRIYDGWTSLEAGVDGGRTPDLIDANQMESAINLSFRGGDATTRPGFRKMVESFPDFRIGTSAQSDQTWVFAKRYQEDPIHHTHVYQPGEYADFIVFLDPGHGYTVPAIPQLIDDNGQNQNEETIYRNGIFQSAIAYSPPNGSDCIMALIGGRLFKIVPMVNSAKVREIVVTDNTGHNLRNKRDEPIAYMVQADKWLIAQDGLSRAIIYDSATARRAITATDRDHTEVPVGTIMTYGMGRIVVIVNERDVAFGDLYGSHNLPDAADSLTYFTERNFLTEGFDAAIPFQQGIATGAVFFPQLDTSTGNGQLLVFAERGAASFFLSLPRDQWKTSQFQILALLTTGMRGHRSIAAVNEDLWFRADDGVRSYRQARSENTGWPHIPLSTNVGQYLDNDSSWLLKYASAIYFDNRIMMTTSPDWNQGRPSHAGMVVVDFDILSTFGVATKPAWEGKWAFPSGIRVLQVLTGEFNGETRAFAFCLDENSQNQLFEISKSDVNDWDDQRIAWQLVSRAFDFSKTSQQSTQFNENEIYDADIWLKDIAE